MHLLFYRINALLLFPQYFYLQVLLLEENYPLKFVSWVRKRKLEGGGGGNCDGKNWLDAGGADGRLKGKDDSGGGGSGSRGKKGGGGSEGGAEVLVFLSFNLLNLFLMVISTPGSPGAFFTRSPAVSFLPLSSSLSKYPTIGFLHRKLTYLWIQVRADFFTSKYSFLLDLVSV